MKSDGQAFVFHTAESDSRLPGGRRRESRGNQRFLLHPTLSPNNSGLPGTSITEQNTEIRHSSKYHRGVSENGIKLDLNLRPSA